MAKFQKCPDVHKIVLSTKSSFPPPPPPKKCQFRGFYTNCTFFSSFWALLGGGVNQICGQEFYGHPDFSENFLGSSRIFMAFCHFLTTIQDLHRKDLLKIRVIMMTRTRSRFSLPGWKLRGAEGTYQYIQSRRITY